MIKEKEIVKAGEKISWDEALENEYWLAPKTNIYETDDNYFLSADMPGVRKENIKVKFESGSLIVMGRSDYSNVSSRKILLQENEFGNFYRKYKISDNVNTNKISAEYENGQVVVTLPKQERVKPKIIEII